MGKRKIVLLVILVLVLSIVGVGVAGAGGTVKGTAEDPNHPGLGEIKYLFNKPGYHFWFTPTQNFGSMYTAGHSYHNVYKYAPLADTTGWCGPVNIPDRAPYNAGGTAGEQAYYKIWDVTDEVWVSCPN